MNFFKGLWRGIVSVSKKVLSVFGPALSSFVAQEAASIFQTVLELVLEAQRRGGSGEAKYNFVKANIRTRLEGELKAIPEKAINLAIELAVAQITPPPAEPSTAPTN